MNLRLNPDQLRQPFGGHQFPNSDGRILRGDKFSDVVKELVDFRSTNGIQMGNPEQEILAYYSIHWPFMIEKVDDNPIHSPTSLFLGWSRWVRRTWRNPPKKFVSTREASERWKVCEKCPFNKEFDWPTTIESSAISQRAYLLRKGIDVPDHLGYCACHGCDIGAMSFIATPDQFAETDKTLEKPAACWVGSLEGSK